MPTVTLPYPPSTNRMIRHFNGRAVKSAEARGYQRNAAMLAAMLGCCDALSGAVEVCIRLHPKKPQRASRVPCRSIDLDNAAKIALDALNGVAWVDDRQIEKLTIIRGEPVPGGALVVQWQEQED